MDSANNGLDFVDFVLKCSVSMQLIFGEHDICDDGDGQVTAEVLNIKVHEDYGPFGFQNDICLINHENIEFGE